MKALFPTASILTLLLVFSINLNAQEFQGEAHYFSKTTMDMDGWGGREMSPEMKAQIAERMKSMFEKTYILTFNREESMYFEDEALDAPGRGGAWRGMMGSFTGGPQYKNVKETQIVQEQEFFGKQFLVTDELPKLEWKMGTETKQIGQYTCFKATAMKPVDELDWSNMRRRNRDNEEEKKESDQDSLTAAENDEDPLNQVEVPKEVEVVAWYAPQIPVNQGPGEYWGLPGLILEVSSGRTTILCSKIILNPEQKKEIKAPTKGKVVTRKEYNDTVKQKMKEMREMYGGRRGGGRRGGN
ncbi:MAG: GLPGLI family protein [Flavobacteriaceae bacterium]|nr:GLPGLI family protein [Bacteroidia bacterium]NNF81119.1 GLPGLI family protein [Flavobacteriaceae bacterium]NNK71157.1 GLPGLI family protein [Flavobacteriaceae bacterium]NNL81498.1 GLPGLI family protein [Flavobacteriaceae bacterium]